jgi:hypothetical protein
VTARYFSAAATCYAELNGRLRPEAATRTMETLDSLLDETYEDATFHDAELLSFAVDFLCATATLEFDIQCRATAPDQQFSLQRGTIGFSGLCFCSVKPALCQTRPTGDSSLLIAADGSLPDERLEISKIVPSALPPGAFVHYLYSSSTNSFLVIGATNAIFSWKHGKTGVR